VLQRIPQRFEETVSEVGVGDAAAPVKEAFAVEVDILESGGAVGVRLMHRELGRFVHFREHASVPDANRQHFQAAATHAINHHEKKKEKNHETPRTMVALPW